VVLAAIAAALGPALRLIPIDTLRFVVGALLLAFGLQWLRKAVLRTSGYKPLHNEGAAFDPPAAPPPDGCGGACMKHLRAFALFWWNFIVGDDWRVAVGLAAALGLTWLLESHDVDAWWLLPVAVALLLAGSVRRESRTGD
jgi:hypothetical protein